MNKKIVTALFLLALAALILVIYFATRKDAPSVPPVTETKTINVSYLCSEGKTIDANYTLSDAAPSTDQSLPPKPTSSVTITLAGGKTITLPQTISADGGRYANSNESIIFWSKGNGALFEENGVQNYKNCIIVAKDQGQTPMKYEDAVLGYTILYPENYTVKEKYLYTALGPNKDISGTSFTISSSTALGTNLSKDSYLSIEHKENATSCSASLFLQEGAATSTKVENGITYSYGTSSDAGAGNRYEENVYTFPYYGECLAVRYFIHYTVFENYPKGSIVEFDKNKVLGTFDSIRKSITLR